ncbi:caspase domain-containing protein [Phellopilus nigrolimitatus]|nr:caspase domain-containing protein [Phellopilus nigrolimitatus]
MGVKRALSYLRVTGPTLGPRCEHRKVALLIGILYHNNECHDTLHGTHEDVRLMKALLINTYHYSAENITVLMDDGDHKAPTKANIEEAMRNLVAGTREGEQLFFHYSGHGSQTECKFDDPTEDDGFDEAIIPCDATSNPDTWIIDNDMNEILVKRLPVNAQLVAVFDMCHSGTALDLMHYRCYKKDLEGSSTLHSQAQAYPVLRLVRAR